MRITCAIGPYLPVPALMGGAVEKCSLAICEEMARVGHEVTMISRRYPGLPNSEMVNGVRHIRVPSRDAPNGKLAYRLYDVRYALRVRAALPPSDITITNSVSMPLLLSRRTAGCIIVDVGRYPKGQIGFYRRADCLRAPSKAIQSAIAEQSPSMASRVTVIPNPLTGLLGHMVSAPIDQARAGEVLYVGRVAREKGLALLFRAFAAIAGDHPSWRLTVVGPWQRAQGGDGEAFIDELRALLPAGVAVTFTGPVFNEAQLRDYYTRAAIFVYPSVAEQGEAFGVAPLEAMACGAAPIVSDLSCFRDFINPGDNGLVFDHRDASAEPLATAMAQLIESSALRARLSAAARETAVRYTPSTVAAEYVAMFRTLLAKKGLAE